MPLHDSYLEGLSKDLERAVERMVNTLRRQGVACIGRKTEHTVLFERFEGKTDKRVIALYHVEIQE